MACADIDSILVAESGRINKEIYNLTLNTSPWLRLIPGGDWPEGMGDIISQMVYERALPSTRPTWTDVLLNDGGERDGSGTCAPTAQQINVGKTLRQFNLQQIALRSDDICLEDLRTPFQVEQQLNATIDALAQNTKYWWEERFRDEYIRVSNHKIIATTGLPELAAAFPAQVPTSKLVQGILDELAIRLRRDGGGSKPTDFINGAPVWMLITDSKTSQDIVKANSAIRQDYHYSTKANEMLAPLGINRVYGSFFHAIDDFMPRYDWVNGAFVRRYPYGETATTYGNSQEISSLYTNAEYQVSVIFHVEVMKNLMPKQPKVPGAMKFDKQNYGGDFQFLNIKDKDCNPLGNIGFFYGRFMAATQPIHVRYGYAIMHRVCPNDLELVDCTEYSS